MKRKDFLVKIHGYVCSDGGIYSWKCKDVHGNKLRIRRKLRTKFYNKEKLLIDDFIQAIKRAYPHIKSLRYYPKRIEVEVRNNTLSKEILSFGKVWSHNWEFPKNLTDNQKKIWIRAFSDSEGTVNNKNYDRYVALDSVNLNGLKTVSDILSEFGITNKIYWFEKSRRARIKVRGKDNLLKFSNLIGFTHPEKQAKLTNAIGSFKQNNLKTIQNTL
ncbi:MAG: LAGLIDADG family homing endonuclease [Nanoarchaeota archaeon]